MPTTELIYIITQYLLLNFCNYDSKEWIVFTVFCNFCEMQRTYVLLDTHSITRTDERFYISVMLNYGLNEHFSEIIIHARQHSPRTNKLVPRDSEADKNDEQE